MSDASVGANARFLAGCATSVIGTACLVVSNKHLLQHPAMRGTGSGVLLLMHRCVSWCVSRTAMCFTTSYDSDFKTNRMAIVAGALLSNASIVTSFLTLTEASITFQQLSRLVVLPLSAALDIALYGKYREAIEYWSLLLLCYGVGMGTRGDVTHTPLALIYAGVCAVCTLGSSALCGHIMKRSGMNAADFLVMVLPYEIATAACVLLLFSVNSTKEGGAKFIVGNGAFMEARFWLLLLVNCSLACVVICLTTWTQAVSSNLMYAVLGQAKTLVTVVLGAAAFGTELSTRTTCGMAIVITIAGGLALGDLKMRSESNSSARRSWFAFAIFVFALAIIACDVAGATLERNAIAGPLGIVFPPSPTGSPLRVAPLTTGNMMDAERRKAHQQPRNHTAPTVVGAERKRARQQPRNHLEGKKSTAHKSKLD